MAEPVLLVTFVTTSTRKAHLLEHAAFGNAYVGTRGHTYRFALGPAACCDSTQGRCLRCLQCCWPTCRKACNWLVEVYVEKGGADDNVG
jgi:hypothetical protein